MPHSRLSFDFWNRHPVEVAVDLIGCTLTMSQSNGQICSGRIIETEAYHHLEEACHAYSFENRQKSDRVAHFFGPAGFSYVYLNYGIHKLFNIITGPDEDGSAVLIRAIKPTSGMQVIRDNRGSVAERNLCNGPGKLTQALGIDLRHNKINLCDSDSPIHLSRRNQHQSAIEMDCGPRVGISKATELNWRFVERGNPFISSAKENKLLKEYTEE